jgi:DNA-binding transcriptional LysR family regulator
MANMGLALVPHCLVKDDIAAGLVATPLADGYMSEMGYYLCYPESRSHRKPLSSFRQWLLSAV